MCRILGGISFRAYPQAAVFVPLVVVEPAGRIDPRSGRREPYPIVVCAMSLGIPYDLVVGQVVVGCVALCVAYGNLVSGRAGVVDALRHALASPAVVVGFIAPVLGSVCQPCVEYLWIEDRLLYRPLALCKLPELGKFVPVHVVIDRLSVLYIAVVIVLDGI